MCNLVLAHLTMVKLPKPRKAKNEEKEREKRKNGKPKKSTGRDGGQSNINQDKQTLKERKKKE
jgi:hypothetical protein